MADDYEFEYEREYDDPYEFEYDNYDRYNVDDFESDYYEMQIPSEESEIEYFDDSEYEESWAFDYDIQDFDNSEEEEVQTSDCEAEYFEGRREKENDGILEYFNHMSFEDFMEKSVNLKMIKTLVEKGNSIDIDAKQLKSELEEAEYTDIIEDIKKRRLTVKEAWIKYKVVNLLRSEGIKFSSDIDEVICIKKNNMTGLIEFFLQDQFEDEWVSLDKLINDALITEKIKANAEKKENETMMNVVPQVIPTSGMSNVKFTRFSNGNGSTVRKTIRDNSLATIKYSDTGNTHTFVVRSDDPASQSLIGLKENDTGTLHGRQIEIISVKNPSEYIR